MLVFMKDTDQECIELLKQAGSITDATTWDNDQQMGQG